jgi:hypothetical protein
MSLAEHDISFSYELFEVLRTVLGDLAGTEQRFPQSERWR